MRKITYLVLAGVTAAGVYKGTSATEGKHPHVSQLPKELTDAESVAHDISARVPSFFDEKLTRKEVVNSVCSEMLADRVATCHHVFESHYDEFIEHAKNNIKEPPKINASRILQYELQKAKE